MYTELEYLIPGTVVYSSTPSVFDGFTENY